MEYVQMSLDDWMQIKDSIRKELNNQRHSFVRTGYFLRKIRDEKLYEQDGYKSLTEFAKEEFNLGASYVSRMISINEKFSLDGYSQQMDPRFEDYKQGALTEMLGLPDSDMQMVTPATSREEIRELKRFNSQQQDEQQDEGGSQEENRLFEVIKDFCRNDRDLINDLFAGERITEEDRLAELINPSGSRTFKKGLYFISFTDAVVKIKKFGGQPTDMSYREFSEWMERAETRLREERLQIAEPAQTSEEEKNEETAAPGGTEAGSDGNREDAAGLQGNEGESKRPLERPAGNGQENDAVQGGSSSAAEGVREQDRATGSEAAGNPEISRGSEADNAGAAQVNPESGSAGDGAPEGGGRVPEEQLQQDGTPEENEDSKPEEMPEKRLLAGFAPAQIEEEKQEENTVSEEDQNDDPYREIIGNMNTAMRRMQQYIERHQWHELKGDLILMKLYLEDAEKIEERYRECS